MLVGLAAELRVGGVSVARGQVIPVVPLNTSELQPQMTSISVNNSWHKEVNVKIRGAGVGGCDILLQPNATDSKHCQCLWGTLSYTFVAWTATTDGGEIPVCSDKKSLGDCYHTKGYQCTVSPSGKGPLAGAFCHCVGK